MIYQFGDSILDTERRELQLHGTPVHVEPQVFDMICALAESNGALLSYDALVDRIWQGRIVSDATIAARISAARKAVGDSGRAQRIIRTMSRRGIVLNVAATSSSDTKPKIDHGHQNTRYATSRDGTAIAFAASGEGPPLLRGGHWLSHLEHDWNSPVWRPLIDRLGAGRHLVRYDPRLTGLSTRDAPVPSVVLSADDMEAVADAAGLDKFPIFAASQSAPAAIALAARRPDRVTRIVIWGGFALGSSLRGEESDSAAMVQLIRSGWGVPGSAFMKAFATLYMPSATAEEIENLSSMQALSADPESASKLRQAISLFDVTDKLAGVKAPVLVMHATGDAIHPVSQGQLLTRSLPDAQLRIFEGQNHVPVPSDPQWEAIMSEAEAFLDQN